MISLLSNWFRGFGGSSALLSVALVGGAVSFGATPVMQWNQEGATAWLSVEVDGALALVDSSVPGQAAIDLVEVAEAGADLEVHQVDGDALVLNRSDGTIRRVDAVTRTAGERLKVLTGGAAGERVGLALGANGDVWVISAGAARKIDPAQVTAIGETQSIPLDMASDADGDGQADADVEAVVDGEGNLWVASQGSVVSSRDGFGSVQSFKGPVDLGLVGDRPVALDVAAQRVHFLGGGSTCDVEVSSGAQVHTTKTVALVTDPANAAAYFLTPGCKLTKVERLIDAGAQIGDTAEVDDWMYLADTTSQQVLIVNVSDPNEQPISRTDRLSANGTDSIELIAVGGVVFYNQPESRAAGVIDRQKVGGLASVEKSAPTGFECVASAESVLVGSPVSLRAVSADDAQTFESATWYEGGGSTPVGDGEQISIPTDEARLARYYFVLADGRRQECPPVDVNTELPVGIVDDQPGIKIVGETGAFSSKTADPADEYLWSIVNGSASIVSGERDRTVSVEFAGAGTVTLSLQITRDGQTAGDEFSVTVRNNRPTPTTGLLGPTTSGPTGPSVPTVPSTPTTGTTVVLPPSPQPVGIATAQNITFIGETSFHFNFHSTRVCSVSGVTVVETATGDLVSNYQHVPSDGPCETLHGSFPGSGKLSFFDIKPGTTYTVTAFIVGEASDGVWPEGVGRDSMTFQVTTKGDPPGEPGHPEQVMIATTQNITFVGETSFHFNFHTTPVCSVSGVSVVETATGRSLGSYRHTPSSGPCTTLHGSFPGSGKLSFFDIKPATTYTVTAFVVGQPSDGVTPEGVGQDSMTFQVTTAGPSTTTTTEATTTTTEPTTTTTDGSSSTTELPTTTTTQDPAGTTTIELQTTTTAAP